MIDYAVGALAILLLSAIFVRYLWYYLDTHPPFDPTIIQEEMRDDKERRKTRPHLGEWLEFKDDE